MVATTCAADDDEDANEVNARWSVVGGG